jgi:hypothetical protein
MMGSMLPGVAAFNESFGGLPQPYYLLSRKNWL